MGVPLRLLLIEDSEDDALLIVRQLERAGYEPSVERVESAATLAAALDRAQWDVVISDYNLPDFNGAVALRQLRDRDADTPFIFVSGTIGEEVAVAAMKAGAQDYVIKGNLRRLGPAVDRELREAQGRRERRRAEPALAESERRHRNLFDTVNLIVLGLNQRGMGGYASPFFLQLTGDGAQEVFGRDWFEFLPERDRPRMRMAFREVLEFGTGFLSHHENSIMTKAGVERMIAWHNTVLHAVDGRANGTLSIGEDITERQSLQAQLIQAQKMEAVGPLAR